MDQDLPEVVAAAKSLSLLAEQRSVRFRLFRGIPAPKRCEEL